MHKNLESSLVFVLNDEGGFSTRPEEPGGGVNHGISRLVLSEWRVKHNRPPPTIDDLRELTIDEAKEIYTDRWTRVGADDLPSGLDYAVFDASTMVGIAGSRALLNETPKDGTATEITLMFLLKLYNKKMHSDSVGKFGKGWGDRIMRVANRAREMK